MAFRRIQDANASFQSENRNCDMTVDKMAEPCSAEHPGPLTAAPTVHPPGAGADAAVQPAHGGAAEGAAAAGEGAAAQDPEERGQDAHGHVQEEPAHQRGGQRRRAAGEGQAGRGCAGGGPNLTRSGDCNVSCSMGSW